jgi:hypothetical protein
MRKKAVGNWAKKIPATNRGMRPGICGPGKLETGITSRASAPKTKIVSSVTRTERDVTSAALLSVSEAVIWYQP